MCLKVHAQSNRTDTIRVVILYADTTHCRKEDGLQIGYSDTHWCFGWKIRNVYEESRNMAVSTIGYLDASFKRLNRNWVVFESVPAHQ